MFGEVKHINNKPKNEIPLNDQGTTLKDAAKITSSKDLESKGLIPVAAVIRHDDYGWQWGEEGQDLGKGNSRLLLNKDKIPMLKDPNKPELGYKVTSGARSPFGTSESNLVNNWGNITYKINLLWIILWVI